MSDTLIEAAKAGDHARAKALIRDGVDVDQSDEQGWTPLNFAAGRGDLDMVRLLIDSGADIFRRGRDKRTPYMIALAAGRASTVRYLKEIQEKSNVRDNPSLERPYCRAYRLGQLRAFSGWREEQINWKSGNDESDVTSDISLGDNRIVFVHEDLSVTESMWREENVLFKSDDPTWREYCECTLGFKVPDDIDLMVPNDKPL